jgi:tryptophanyl-tRNA synthetase
LREYFSLFPSDCEIIVFEQSKVRRINDITWVLSSVTPYSLMLRAHAFKDSKAK